MPQMYPLNWMFMYLVFIMILLFTINKIFYSNNTQIKSISPSHKSLHQHTNLWKW